MSRLIATYPTYGLLYTTFGLGVRHTGQMVVLLGSLLPDQEKLASYLLLDIAPWKQNTTFVNFILVSLRQTHMKTT